MLVLTVARKIWRSPVWGILITILLLIAPGRSLLSQTEEKFIEDTSCPEDLQQLTASLLKDLPSYSNRVIQRTQRANRQAGIRNFIVTASAAEYEPLDLPRIKYSQTDNSDTEQVFFTVLERQYHQASVTTIQTYHWLFLTKTSNGWHTVMMFSRFGNSQANQPPAPPRETTNGIIGQGVQLWLRDCRASSLSFKN